jgi:hypothetical protein
MLDLNKQEDREKLEDLISNDVDEFCETYYEQGHRNHLGASGMGEPCWRKLYYSFRWVKEEKFDGRMMRLFNVGHSAEPRFVAYLRGIGFEVKEFDENGKQFRISGAMGHYGGSLDGMCKAPERYQLSEDLVFLNEFKTNGTGKGFSDVEEKGLQKAKPMHYSQMSQYGYKMGLRFGLYIIENKNDSCLIIKIVELDWNLGAQLEKKANDIVNSKEPPPRISENPAVFECKYCSYTDICHKGETPEKNCRSCRNASPVEDAQWFCSAHNSNIPSDFIRIGCDLWLPI